MVRDYSQFLPGQTATNQVAQELSPLQKIGWQAFFAQQISDDDPAQHAPVRVIEVHRSGLHVLGDGIDTTVPPRTDATVGDWLLLNAELPTQSEVLDRKSLFKRRAPGRDRTIQLIAANVDTAFIVTSCNQDFNVARLERYIALAFDADAAPVVILTKSDLCKDVSPYEDATRKISSRVPVLSMNALSDAPQTLLADWCKTGQTVAFLGSSGVGKSTLVNALIGDQSIETAAVREDDAKGRHTTTHRHLHFLPNGCAVLDTPGMRELQLADAEAGIADVFADIAEIATQCKFNDCAHDTEPGCAIRAAVERGDIDQTRLDRWDKLVTEDQFNSASPAQRRAGDKAFHKRINAIQRNNRK